MVAGAWWRGLEGAVLGQVISQTLNCALNFFCLRAEARRARVPLAYTGALSEMSVLLRFSLPVVLTGLFAGPVNWLCSSMLVNLPNGYEQLGIYNAANQWRIALAFLAGILAQVALPILASASKCGGCHERQRALRVILGVSVSAVILPSVILIALAPGIVQLYGKSFGISPGLFVLLIVAESLASIGSILYTCLLSLQRAWLGLVGNVMWIAVLLTTFRLLITYQAVGLAWAQVISYLVSLIIITPPILFHLVYRKHPK
jgi:O-antigen/teichoic acid export membrane protein